MQVKKKQALKLKTLGLKCAEVIFKASGILPTAAYSAPVANTQININEISNIIYNQMTSNESDCPTIDINPVDSDA